MTTSIDNDLVIRAQRVPDDERIRALSRYFGPRTPVFENAVFDTMGALCAGYHGGYWDFYELSNGGFYMAPVRDRNMNVVVTGNQYRGEVSSDAAGIIACLFVLNAMAWRYRDDHSVNLYHWLRHYALDHAEAGEILRAVD